MVGVAGTATRGQAPAIEFKYSASDITDESRVMTSEYHSAPSIYMITHQRGNDRSRWPVQRRGRLVEQQHLRFDGQRPGET
ncbi:hypothetical protein A5745_10890 [Mycobacterium sp. IS-2888]|nr:hypothetical protein A5745_10890 [Mycobacterium sp. IS-2888]